jgi:hypothetical protein
VYSHGNAWANLHILGQPNNLLAYSLTHEPARTEKKTVTLAHGATRSFYAATDCHWLPLHRDLHSCMAAIAIIFFQNDRVDVD